MKVKALSKDVIEEALKAPSRGGSYDAAPYIEIVTYARDNEGGAEVELEEGESERQVKARLRKAASGIQGLGRLKFLDVDEEQKGKALQFVIKEPRPPRQPRQPRTPRAEGEEAPARMTRKQRREAAQAAQANEKVEAVA